MGKLVDEAGHRVVDMPAGHDEKEAGIGAKAAKEIIGEPFPDGVALKLRVGFFAAFDRIVDDANVEAVAGNLPVHGGIAEGPALANELDDLGVALPGAGIF